MSNLQENLTYLDDFRVDTSSDTVDINTEGLRAINFIINDLKSRHEWAFTEKDINLNYYKGINEYSLVSNYVEMIGLFEQMNFLDPFTRISPIEFDRKMNKGVAENLIADDYSGRTSILKINFINSKSESQEIIANDSYNSNGTWVATGTASDVLTDNKVYFSNTGSVRFTASGSGTATLTNTITSVDVSSYNKKYAMFFKIFIEDASGLTSVNLIWGSSNSNYHTKTVTSQFNGRPFANGLNLIGLEIDSTADVGTTDDSAISYLQLNLVHSSALGKVYVGEIDAITPDPLRFVYYSSDWTYDYSASSWYDQFQNSDDANNDYGAWTGRYDWFNNIVNTGASWIILTEMQEYERAEQYRIRYEGQDGNGGIVAKAIKKLPSRIKKKEPPSITVSFGEDSNYYDLNAGI